MISIIPNTPAAFLEFTSPFLIAAANVSTDGTLTGALIALIALTAMEIVLGIDNLVFLSVLSGRLPKEQQRSARLIGLILAMLMRIVLLGFIFVIMKLNSPIFHLDDFVPWAQGKAWLQENQEINGVSVKDLIMIGGGLFLLWKSVMEIHHLVGGVHAEQAVRVTPTYASVILQVIALDLVFSIDSVITAVGMADQLWVMITAVLISVGIMMVFANQVADFVERNPTVKMLAVSFLVMIGAMLVAEGCGTHVNKGYVYFAMAFSLIVEVLNLRVKHKTVASNSPEPTTPGHQVQP